MEFDPNFGFAVLAALVVITIGGMTRGQFFGRNDK